MHKTKLVDFFDGMNDKLFYALVIFIQIIFIFQGLDFADAGFHAVFYQRIFSDPSTVQYNFMFWFTGIVGGIWLKLFPGLGILGIRLAGIICTTITCLVTYKLLKRQLDRGPLRLSLILIVLFLATSIKEFNYNDISALFFVCAASLLFSGLTKEKPLCILLAGLFISLNTFSRVSNIAGIILIIAIWYSGYLDNKSGTLIVRQCLYFLTGFILMSGLMIWLMMAMHHELIFLDCLKLVTKMGIDSKDSHGLYSLFKMSVVQYGKALSESMVVLVIIGIVPSIWKKLRDGHAGSIPFLRFIQFIILGILTAIIIYRAKKDPDFWLYLYFFYAGTGLIAAFLIVTGREQNKLKLLTAIGCIMLLVLPFGSDYVLLTVGKYSVWILLPVTIDYLLKIHLVNSRIVLDENDDRTYEQRVSSKELKKLQNICIYLTLVYISSVCYYYPYFDRASRTGMRFTVDNLHLRGIYTTESRARVINEMLAASALYVKPDDYVIAYESIPMYYFLTGAKPYMQNSWLRLYNDVVFKEELYGSLRKTRIFPVVVMQKRSTIGNDWPCNYDEDFRFKPVETGCLMNFLKVYQYRQVWENDFFKIFIPASKMPVLSEN